MILEFDLAIPRLPIMDPGRDHFFQFHVARVLVVVNQFEHLFEERDTLLEPVFLRLVDLDQNLNMGYIFRL